MQDGRIEGAAPRQGPARGVDGLLRLACVVLSLALPATAWAQTPHGVQPVWGAQTPSGVHPVWGGPTPRAVDPVFGGPTPGAALPASEAPTLGVAETENLVRARYFEGLPEEEARRIGPEGAARLLEMLADPSEAESHDQILLALGLCAPTGALEAIAAWAESPRTGEIDRARFRAWQALPYALGHLAEHDPRAVARLEAQLAADPPRWRHRHHRGERLRRLSRRAAANALAESGTAPARRVLDRAIRSSRDPDFEGFLRKARARHARRVQERSQ